LKQFFFLNFKMSWLIDHIFTIEIAEIFFHLRKCSHFLFKIWKKLFQIGLVLWKTNILFCWSYIWIFSIHLAFHYYERHPLWLLMSLSRKYGPVFTMWIGNNPFVYITDFEIAKKLFSTKSCSGRPQTLWGIYNSNYE